MNIVMNVFDCIICGSGISGSYLAYCLNKASVKNIKNILVLDNRAQKDRQTSTKNLSFWSKDTFPFSECAEKTWKKVAIHDAKNYLTFGLNSYRYYSLSEGALQTRMWESLKKNNKLFFKNEYIVSICEENNLGCVKTEGHTYYGKYIFDSVSVPECDGSKTRMQGKSWRIRFIEHVFDSSAVSFMDFRTLNTKELMFFYILPFSKTEAIIEVAHFASTSAKQQDYEHLLHRYLSAAYAGKTYKYRENIGTKNSYSMFVPKSRKNGHVIRIGRAAGLIKPTSGFGVIKIFKDTDKLVYALANDLPIPRVYSGIPYWLSDICMTFMTRHTNIDSSFFISLFKNHSADTILSFLNEESSSEDLKQLIRVPVSLLFAAHN